jgi:hypothetical protein
MKTIFSIKEFKSLLTRIQYQPVTEKTVVEISSDFFGFDCLP